MGLIENLCKIIKLREDAKTRKCSICGKIVSDMGAHVCKYCFKTHCNEHLQPEQHNCTEKPTKPKGMKTGRIIYRKGETIYMTK